MKKTAAIWAAALACARQYRDRRYDSVRPLRFAVDTGLEWKGRAAYFDLATADATVRNVAWSYSHPTSDFALIAGYLSFYPNRVGCYVDDELTRAQPGGFCGGWVTSDLAGPIKGPPGTEMW